MSSTTHNKKWLESCNILNDYWHLNYASDKHRQCKFISKADILLKFKYRQVKNYQISSVPTTVKMEHLNKWNIWTLKIFTDTKVKTYNKMTTIFLHVWHHNCQQLKDIMASLPHPIKWRRGHYGNIVCCLVLRTTCKNYEIHQHPGIEAHMQLRLDYNQNILTTFIVLCLL